MRLIFTSIILYIFFFIEQIYSYLSPDQFRDLVELQEDYESPDYFKYFLMKLKYFPNDPLTYLRKCKEGSLFGYFRYGNITNYLSYEDYGSLGINMNLIVNTDYLKTGKNDTIDFYLNGELSQRVFLNQLKNNTFPPIKNTYCEKPVMIFNISLIFINKKTSQYSPIEMSISSNIDILSHVDWAISRIRFFKQACPKKCVMCNSINCLSCGKNMIMKSGSCTCDSNNDFFDFADVDEKIKCQNKYQQVLEENYSIKYLSNLWYWNTYPITPFNFRYSCSDTPIVFFGGPNDFGDGDTLTKFIKFNDKNIFKDYQPSGFNYNYVPYSNYKIEFGVAFINWNSTYANLAIATTSKSNPLDLTISSTDVITCNFNNSVLYIQDYFSYPSLSDNPHFANITFVASSMPSRKTNNFGLTNFKFYFSPCYKTCATCSSPAIDACNTCLDPNAVLQNGKCVCAAGLERDSEHPLFPCVPITSFNIVSDGILQASSMQSVTVLYNNIESTSYYCQESRQIVGGGVQKKFNYTSNLFEILDGENKNVYIDLVVYVQDISYYKVKVKLELITDEDLTLTFPFSIYYNDETEIKEFKTKQIKYLKYSDAGSTVPINCYDGQPNNKYYKHYSLVFYVTTNHKLFYLKIQNNFNNFWGVLNLNYDFYNCHKNCGNCLDYTQNDCTSCNAGMVENILNYNKSRSTFSCICDEANGFVKTSNDYSPLVCSQFKKTEMNFFYINDLDSENFDTTIWKSNFRQLNNENDVQTCEYTKVLGNYGPQKYSFYERKIDFIKNIPNFDFFQADFSFNVYFFKKVASFIVKVYLDNNYIWGNTNTVASIEETILCNERATFSKKFLNFTYFNNDYFKDTMNKKNPTMRIQVISDSECSFNSDCGWGINNLKIKVNKANINGNSTCPYRPFINCPCAPLSSQCTCYPGYYSLKASWGDYNCLPCIANCLNCPSNKCSECNYGYTLVNNICLPSPKGMLQSQNTMMKIDLSKYYSNSNLEYTGISLNFWAKFGEVSSIIEKPLALIDPFLLTYNSTFGNYYMKNSKFNYLFSFSNYFQTIINYTTTNPKAFYESSWVPYSIGLSYSNTFKNFFIQISINNEVGRSTIQYETKIPKMIILFNYFSKIQYRYIKIWDRFLNSDELSSINYIQDYTIAPSDLIYFLKLTEGYMKNRGNSNLIFLYYVNSYLWGYDNNPSPPSCNENEYYDPKTSMCSACDNNCKHCYSGSSNGCIECNEPNSFLDISNRICYPVCQNNQIAVYRYESNKMCQGSCPSSCEKCDNLNGCTLCKKDYILYKNSCVSFCTPEMASEIPQSCIQDKKVDCFPSAKIKNRNNFFFMDGTDFNLNVDLIDCNRPLKLKWITSLKETIIKENGRSLFLDSTKVKIPRNHTFQLFLYDELETQILDRDKLVIEFMTYSVNGGKIVPFYIDDVLNFSLEKFNQNIAPSFGGTMKYIWTCPSWVPFQSCNIRINKPLIKVDLKEIADKKYIMTDSLYDVKVQVLSGGVSKASYRGFFIVYSQPNFNSYFNFTIKNSTIMSYNDEIDFGMEFKNNLHSQIIKENILIQWNINTTQAVFINGFSLPEFRIKFVNTSGTFNTTCTIFYRNDTFAQKTLSKSFIFTIPAPPNTGILEAYPTYSITMTNTRINLLASNFIFEDDPLNTNFRYEYFYRNIFGEYLWIMNKYDNPNQLSRNLIPITDSVKVECFYDHSSLSKVQATADLTVKMNSLLDYNKVDDIFIYDVENTILLLEAYSLNLRNHTMAENTADLYSRKILNKLYELLLKNNKTEARSLIHLNDDKLATILEAVSLRFNNYTQISTTFNNIINEIMRIASENKDDSAFNLFYCNNYLRAMDNLLNINPSNINLAKVDFKILENYKDLVMKSYREIPKGSYKMANLQNMNIFGITVDSKFLKNDIIYINDETVNPFKTKSPIFFDDYSSIYVGGNTSPSDLDKISVTFPNNVIERFDNDFIILIKHYTNWNPVIRDPSNYTDDNWYSVTSDIIEIVLVDINFKNLTSQKQVPQIDTVKNSSGTFNITTYKNVTFFELSKDEKEYSPNEKIYIESGLVIFNFTLPKKYSLSILNYTSCVKISRDPIMENYLHFIDDMECNTWFDYNNNIVQCECDTPGYYSVAYNPEFKYNRKPIQFPQTSDSIVNPWGMGTMGFMLGLLLFVTLYLYLKDRKELTHFSVAANKKKYYDELRKRLNESSSAIKEMTFTNLYARIFKYSNDFYNILNFREFYFLRSHRFFMLLVRFYIIVVLCFFKQDVHISPELFNQVELRDIAIKSKRGTIYNWTGDWVEEIMKSLTLAIPIGIVMFLCPRLAEWLFHYDETTLRFYDNCTEVSNLGQVFYSHKLNNLNEIYSSKINTFQHQQYQASNDNRNYESSPKEPSHNEMQNVNIEMQDMTKRQLLPSERFKHYQLAFRKKRAFLNFNRIVNSIITDIKKDLFVNEKHDILPEDLAPLYSKRLNGQVENYEVRMFHIRAKLHQNNEKKKQKDTKNEILKNREQLAMDLKLLLDGRDLDKKEMEVKYGYRDYKNFRKLTDLRNTEPEEFNENDMDKKNNVSIKDSFSNNEILKSNTNSLNQQGKLIKEQDVQIDKSKKKEEENEDDVQYSQIDPDNEGKKEEVEEQKEDLEEKNDINDMFDSDTTALVKSNAFIPTLIKKNKNLNLTLILKISIIILILLGLTYFTAWKITVIKNQGGKNKAIFWVIMVSISITFNYLIFLPIICLIKTKIILTYGPFHPRKFFCSFKYFLFLLLITEVDRAVFKELKETIKNNNSEYSDKVMTSYFGLDNETEIANQNEDSKENDDGNKDEGKEKKDKINANQNNKNDKIKNELNNGYKNKDTNYLEINRRDKNINTVNKLQLEDDQRKENFEKEENDNKKNL